VLGPFRICTFEHNCSFAPTQGSLSRSPSLAGPWLQNAACKMRNRPLAQDAHEQTGNFGNKPQWPAFGHDGRLLPYAYPRLFGPSRPPRDWGLFFLRSILGKLGRALTDGALSLAGGLPRAASVLYTIDRLVVAIGHDRWRPTGLQKAAQADQL